MLSLRWNNDCLEYLILILIFEYKKESCLIKESVFQFCSVIRGLGSILVEITKDKVKKNSYFR